MFIIAAFPGVGVQEYLTKYPHVAYLDPNNLTFDYQHQGFLNQLDWRRAQGLYSIVDASPLNLAQIVKVGMGFITVYPQVTLLAEYQARWLAAPAPYGGAAYASAMTATWYPWLANCAAQKCRQLFELKTGETLDSRLPFSQDPDHIIQFGHSNRGDNAEY